MKEIKQTKVKSIEEIISFVTNLRVANNISLAFRGETKDYKETALTPSLYRKFNYINKENLIYKEMQRFNDNEFLSDRTAFDKLSRMQHYSAPTRLLDISADIMSAIYFAIDKKEDIDKDDAIIYIFELKKEELKYYDSDSVSVVSNIAKIPLISESSLKSKKSLLCDVTKYRNNKKKFNKGNSSKFLRHEIREEKAQFEPIINPKDLTSIQCIYPKLTSSRIKSQKGFFLLFGLNPDNAKESIKLIENGNLLDDSRVKHPISKIHKLRLKSSNIKKMKKDLKNLGVTEPFIYPEIDKVADYLKKSLK